VKTYLMYSPMPEAYTRCYGKHANTSSEIYVIDEDEAENEKNAYVNNGK